MPLALHAPAGRRAGDAVARGRLRLWVAARREECRRAQRFLSDRRRLLELDGRLLGDVGLTREEVLRGVPFRRGAQAPRSSE